MNDIRITRQGSIGPNADAQIDTIEDDAEGHSATIYRRRRGPYPLRNSSLPDAEDRVRREGALLERRRPTL